MNVYKLATVVILLNFLIGAAASLGDVGRDYDDYSISHIDNQLADIDNAEATLNSDDSDVSTAQDVLTIGSGIKWTRVIKDIFINALNPFSIAPDDFEDGFGKALAYLLVAFRNILGVFMIIKVFNIIKNRDQK